MFCAAVVVWRSMLPRDTRVARTIHFYGILSYNGNYTLRL